MPPVPDQLFQYVHKHSPNYEVPGAGMVVLVIVLVQAGIPEAGLALIFAVDRPLVMCRTVINVSGDAAVSALINKLSFKEI